MLFKKLNLALTASVLLSTSAVAAEDLGNRGDGITTQNCMYNVLESSPSSRYTISDDGASLVDSSTGLTWARCDLGQTWNNETKVCDGNQSTHNWLDAHLEAQSYSAGTITTGWRVPNIKELATIIEERCSYPTVNTEIFFSTTRGQIYWASTPYKIGSAGDKAYLMEMGLGIITAADKSNEINVKLVRD